jgi:hypothetical protein
MAILGSDGGPSVIKSDSNPIKAEVLTHFGHPVIKVELEESQLEMLLRTAGDFMAGYFPFEEKIAMFYTQPLVTEYPLPEDAYWIKSVKWDSVTRISDIFGAESFLFCFADGMKILRSDDELIDIKDWDKEFKTKTPFGNKKVIFNRHEDLQNLIKINYTNGNIICTPNHPIKVNNTNWMDDWLEAEKCDKGTILITNNGKSEVTSIENIENGPTTTIYVPGAHCFYGCHDGNPIIVH